MSEERILPSFSERLNEAKDCDFAGAALGLALFVALALGAYALVPYTF